MESKKDISRRVMKRRRINLTLIFIGLNVLTPVVRAMTEEQLDAMLTLVNSTETLTSM